MTPQPEMQAVVVKTTLKGEIVWKIQGPPDVDAYKPGADGTPKRYNPTNIAIAPNGDVYVGDGYGSYYVNQYNSKGEYIRTFGGKGAEAGQLAEPHGIWVDTRGARSRCWSSPIAATTGCSASRSTASTSISSPASACRATSTSSKGIVVIPDLHGRVTLIDRDNQIIEHLGDSNAPNWNNPLRTQPRDKFIPGQFICPHGACFDHDGNIFVVEWVEVGRVTKLRKVA